MSDKPEKFTVFDFLRRYPDDDTCLLEIFRLRYGDLPACPGCRKAPPKFHRLRSRKCFECGSCNHKIEVVRLTERV